jgi:hypothetical protein
LPALHVDPDARFVRAEDGRARLRVFSESDVLRFEVRRDGELLPAVVTGVLELPFDDVLDLEIRAVDAAGVLSLSHLVTFHRSAEPPVFGDVAWMR